MPVAASLWLTSHTAWGQVVPTITIQQPLAVRGAVYLPAGAFNAPQMWKNFSLAETRRDFGCAQEIHLNALRIWASYEYWQMEPKPFQASLDQLLDEAQAHGIRILVSLFENDGVAPTPENMWTTDPKRAFDVCSPALDIVSSAHQERWEKPREYLKWFMQNYRNDQRLLAIEVMNEPDRNSTPFARSMFQTAKSMEGCVPLTIGSDSIENALNYLPLGLDIIEFHVNFPPSRQYFELEITNAITVGKQNHLPVWLTEWQRLRPEGDGWGKTKIPQAETLPNYASLASIVHQYQIGNFFWSLMVKPAYLPPQRAQGTINGLFWPDGSVWSLRDARAIADDPSLKIPERKVPPTDYERQAGLHSPVMLHVCTLNHASFAR
jgi:hypothetical protein